jgi:hypothetical protein
MADMLIGLVLTLGVPAAYLWFQARALFIWRGPWLLAALVPVVVMGAAVVIMMDAIDKGSNLAPIVVIFAAPPCLIWLAVAGWLRGLRQG